jgi:hypothetical protein
MKTTALIILSFILVLPGSMNLVKSDLRTESEFNSFSPADYSLNLSNPTFNESAISDLSIKPSAKENPDFASKPSLRLLNSSLKSYNAELPLLSEKEVNIEKWMIEINSFNKYTSVFSEDEIQIEEWMTCNFISNTEGNIALEQDLNLEDWMTGLESWKEYSSTNSVILIIDLEEDLKIENWMTEPENWVDNNNNESAQKSQ